MSESLNIQHQTIYVNGINLHVAQAGPENGQPVILLHGFPEFWYGWRHQIEALAAAGYRVWIPDQRGYNTSDKPDGIPPYNRDELITDVVGLIEAANGERCILIGHDWGGVVAWHVANQHPDKLKKLIVLNCPHPKVFRDTLRSSWRQRLKSGYMLFFQLPVLPELILRANRAWLMAKLMQRTSNQGTFSQAEMQLYREAWMQPRAMTAMLNWYRAAGRVKSKRPPEPVIRVPTRLIWGKQDAFLGDAMAQPSIDYCEDGELIFVEDATHWIASDQPAQVNRLILEFLGATS